MIGSFLQQKILTQSEIILTYVLIFIIKNKLKTIPYTWLKLLSESIPCNKALNETDGPVKPELKGCCCY
jgi:hypothetical protein